MSTALARSIDVTNFSTLDQLSNMLSKAADVCPKAFFGKPAAIAGVILFGQEVGLTPMMALRSVHVINGKMTMSAELMLTLALQRGIKKKWTEATNEAATLVLIRDGEEMLPVRFTLADAKTAELLGNPTWKKFPGNMLRARAITNAIRMHCPDILGPCIYSEEEMRDMEESAPPAPLSRRAEVIESVAPAGAYLGDLTDAPDSGMRLESTKSHIKHCDTPEKLHAWLKARAPFISKASTVDGANNVALIEYIKSVIEKMSKRVTHADGKVGVESAIMLDAAGLMGAKSIDAPVVSEVVDTTGEPT